MDGWGDQHRGENNFGAGIGARGNRWGGENEYKKNDHTLGGGIRHGQDD